ASWRAAQLTADAVDERVQRYRRRLRATGRLFAGPRRRAEPQRACRAVVHIQAGRLAGADHDRTIRPVEHAHRSLIEPDDWADEPPLARKDDAPLADHEARHAGDLFTQPVDLTAAEAQ